MLKDFKSLCKIFLLCKYATPIDICKKSFHINSSLKWFTFFFSSNKNLPKSPSLQYSIIIFNLLSSLNESMYFTTYFEFNFDKNFDSFSIYFISGLVNPFNGICLRTYSFVSFSFMTLYTIPYEPVPNSSIIL